MLLAGGLVVVFWTRPTGWVVLGTAVAVLLAVGVVSFLARPPLPGDRRRPASPTRRRARTTYPGNGRVEASTHPGSPKGPDGGRGTRYRRRPWERSSRPTRTATPTGARPPTSCGAASSASACSWRRSRTTPSSCSTPTAASPAGTPEPSAARAGRAEEVIGRHFRLFYPPEVAERGHPEHELAVALRDGHYEEEGWRLRKDGTRFWANVVITAVHDPAGRHVGFAKVTRDTSERRRLELEREAALEALREANAELAVLNERLQQAADDQAQFLAVTAHELRTPVALLSGSAELLAEHGAALSEEERQETFRAMTSGRHAGCAASSTTC